MVRPEKLSPHSSATPPGTSPCPVVRAQSFERHAPGSRSSRFFKSEWRCLGTPRTACMALVSEREEACAIHGNPGDNPAKHLNWKGKQP